MTSFDDYGASLFSAGFPLPDGLWVFSPAEAPSSVHEQGPAIKRKSPRAMP